MSNRLDFIDCIKEYKPIYLCADTHNFQITQINNDIVQIVSGTGGAEPDQLFTENEKIDYQFINKYNITGYKKNSFGYIIVEYIKLIDIENNIVNKKYIYSIIRNNYEINIKYEGEYKLNTPINIIEANKRKNQLCNNLSEKNLVKDKQNNDIYCYRKQK